MTLDFSGDLWHWRGPAPHYFVRVPAELCPDLRAAAKLVSYGWGVVPVTVHIGDSEYTTSLFPKDGGYLVPVRAAVRAAEGLEEGEAVAVRLSVGRA